MGGAYPVWFYKSSEACWLCHIFSDSHLSRVLLRRCCPTKRPHHRRDPGGSGAHQHGLRHHNRETPQQRQRQAQLPPRKPPNHHHFRYDPRVQEARLKQEVGFYFYFLTCACFTNQVRGSSARCCCPRRRGSTTATGRRWCW